MSSEKHPAPTQWIIFTLLAFAAVMILAGCGEAAAKDTKPVSLVEYEVQLEDGRLLNCVGEYHPSWNRNGGLSCDWANAREAGE